MCDGTIGETVAAKFRWDSLGEEMVVSAPAVDACEASVVIHATMTATASQLSSQQGTSAASYTLPTGTFGSRVVQRTSMVPSSAAIDYSTLPVNDEVDRFTVRFLALRGRQDLLVEAVAGYEKRLIS